MRREEVEEEVEAEERAGSSSRRGGEVLRTGEPEEVVDRMEKVQGSYYENGLIESGR